jgi:hypothetical protein
MYAPELGTILRKEGVIALLEQDNSAPLATLPATATGAVAAEAERAARKTLRTQIAGLERQLSDAFVTAYPMGGLERHRARPGGARLLGFGELEQVRDDLAERLHAARVSISRRAQEQEEHRVLLERMLLDPGRYRFTRLSQQTLGEPGCGVWQVRPRLGLIGMLMGWWQVKLSSGCPLARGRG